MGRLMDLKGLSFDRLTVLCRAERSSNPKDSYAYWICRCSCGNPKLIRVKGADLTRGRTRSCGCYQKERASRANKTHGMTKSKLYGVWQGMKRRCDYEKHNRYAVYGGRSIRVCEAWEDSFLAFREWALNNGYEDGLSIDRIDTNGDYTPGNCRWTTMESQQNNRNNNRVLLYAGEAHTMAEWERIKGYKKGLLHARLTYQKWSVEKSLTTPVRGAKQ